ncbi:hypothetical protein [Hymenobacter algoricola]|uniref:Uncharacterized protein n=1 Tax=Hymenobacter algoricola TaxID=486267 RepID=A0ABP7NU86_9BACT
MKPYNEIFPNARQPIRVRVNDKQVQDTLFLQVAEVEGWGVMQPRLTGYQCSFFINVLLYTHASNGGEEGAELPFTPRPVRLAADNNTIMVPQTETNRFGIYAIRDMVMDTDATWAEKLRTAPEDAYLQGDAFEQAIKSGEVHLINEIVKNVTVAQYPPFNRYQ